jgi:hypothetical protein
MVLMDAQSPNFAHEWRVAGDKNLVTDANTTIVNGASMPK